MKRVLLFVGMFLSMLSVVAEDNVLQTIEIEPVKTGMPASYYQQTYQRWESQVESIYNSVSSYSKIDSDTKEEIEGYSTWSGSSHMMMKQQLVKAQLEMRNIRQEAARNGTNIPMSHWENVTVH